jgi:Ca2+-binding EF-hand superfamily protein
MSCRKLTLAALIVAVAGSFNGAAFAQQGDADARMAQIEKRFKEADKDGDGKLTLDEAQAGMPRVAKNFDRIDKDKKGYVTLDEIKAAAAAAMGGR